MTDNAVGELIKQMTLEEKAGMCSGGDFWHTKAIERLGIPRSMVTDGPHGLRGSRLRSRTIWGSMKASKRYAFLPAAVRRQALTVN